MQVTITGSNFADWDAIDARCRDPVYTDISRCSVSTVCELVAVTASERQCRGQVRRVLHVRLVETARRPLQWVICEQYSQVCTLCAVLCVVAQCRTNECVWTSGDGTPALFANGSDLSISHPMGTVSLRRGSVVNYMRVLSWTHDTIVAEVPEGVGAGYELVVSVSGR